MRPLLLILGILLLPLLVLSFITAGTATKQKEAAAQFVKNKRLKSRLQDTVHFNPDSADKILVELNKK